jgi:hypothetical protein
VNKDYFKGIYCYYFGNFINIFNLINVFFVNIIKSIKNKFDKIRTSCIKLYIIRQKMCLSKKDFQLNLKVF